MVFDALAANDNYYMVTIIVKSTVPLAPTQLTTFLR